MAHTWSPHLSVLYARPFPHWWYDTTHAFHDRIQVARATRADRPRTPPRHYPERYEYLERASMTRAMYRL
jgi:hypothetical protein